MNLANNHLESLTLKHFLRHIQPNDSLYQYLDSSKGEGHARAFYPSVDCGYIDTSKLQKVFKPTPLVQVMGQTIEFFKQIKPNQYLKEKRAVLNELPTELRKQVIKTIQDQGAFL
jgi:hypothetical protein